MLGVWALGEFALGEFGEVILVPVEEQPPQTGTGIWWDFDGKTRRELDKAARKQREDDLERAWKRHEAVRRALRGEEPEEEPGPPKPPSEPVVEPSRSQPVPPAGPTLEDVSALNAAADDLLALTQRRYAEARAEQAQRMAAEARAILLAQQLDDEDAILALLLAA